jgi:hypothetical protein
MTRADTRSIRVKSRVWAVVWGGGGRLTIWCSWGGGWHSLGLVVLQTRAWGYLWGVLVKVQCAKRPLPVLAGCV